MLGALLLEKHFGGVLLVILMVKMSCITDLQR